MPTTYKASFSVNGKLTEATTTDDGSVLTTSQVGNVKKSATLSGTTSPSSDLGTYDKKSLSGGALTIDLTAVTSTYIADKDFTGESVHTIAIYANENNTGAITVTTGLTNGYNVTGDSSFSCKISPGGYAFLQTPGATGAGAVSGTAKTIDFAGTGTDSFDIILVGG